MPNGQVFVHACNAHSEDDTITEADLQRVRDMAKRLNADPSKTLAQHQWILDLKTLWNYGRN